MKVDFYRHQLGKKNLQRFARVLESIFLTTGQETALFEQKFAAYLGQKHALGLMSGTAALHVALLALGVGPGDEVITTPMTFVATALAIMHTGARPVFVDVEPDTGNLDVNRVAAALTPRTKAILPVHLYGQMVDMRALKTLAQEHHLFLIEDAAHCLEGERDGVRVGELADVACFSFYPTKSITCGEGGALTTNRDDLLELLKKLRLHGMSTHAEDRYTGRYRHYDVDVEGWKYNMPNLAAALLIDQLDEIEDRRRQRERLTLFYRDRLANLPGLELPTLLPGVKQGYHLFTIWVEPTHRDAILWGLQERGVGVAVNYRPCHLYSLFRERFGHTEGDFLHAERLGQRTISLPLYPGLREEEAEYVVDVVREVVRFHG
ncbi:MAG: DegT/DnrJ/EryC1/StrS family aminotransferase [Desulfobacca sp.]|uniref:DegT/DnrJ/EryC1/StrS family aminotransferase n=1 Tax=Desulfobacca sp. TaxID=2067990 RepID=UPI00404A295B